jgi:hypothetical protein
MMVCNTPSASKCLRHAIHDHFGLQWSKEVPHDERRVVRADAVELMRATSNVGGNNVVLARTDQFVGYSNSKSAAAVRNRRRVPSRFHVVTGDRLTVESGKGVGGKDKQNSPMLRRKSGQSRLYCSVVLNRLLSPMTCERISLYTKCPR